MPGDLSSYTKESFQAVRTTLIKQLVGEKETCAQSEPHAVLLGGQSGAGKTMLHDIYDSAYQGNIIVVNGDDYRSYHPHYDEIAYAYGKDAALYTAEWSGKMTEALVNALSIMQYNLLVEDTLRTVEVPVKTAKLLKSRGYHVTLSLMAVKPEISYISCQLRYEKMCAAGMVPRATSLEHHNEIVREIVGNVKALEELDLFEGVSLYSRTGKCLFESDAEDMSKGEIPVAGKHKQHTASAVLHEIMFGEWTLEEKRHYEFLQNMVEALKGGKNE